MCLFEGTPEDQTVRKEDIPSLEGVGTPQDQTVRKEVISSMGEEPTQTQQGG